MRREWALPLTAFAFAAALVGLALTDTWGGSLFVAAAAAALAGDAYVTRRARPHPTLRERSVAALTTCFLTWLMVIPALAVLLLIAYVVLEPLS